MNISRKAVLALVVLGGLLAFSAGIGTINSDVFAEETPDNKTDDKTMVVKRETGSIWNYQTTCKETAEAVTTTDGKATTYKWETEKTINTLIYFGDFDKNTNKWDILKSSRETSKLLKSYMAGDKDLKAAKEPFYRLFAGPRMYAGPADFMGKIEYTGPLGDREWDEAVLNHLPMLRKTTFKSGDNGTDKVVVAGKEVGEYSYRIGGMLVTSDEIGKVKTHYVRGTLRAKRDDGRTITITGYASKWEGNRSVPVMVSWKMKIEYTTGNTKYSLEREYECLTLGADSTAVVLSSLDATRMNAQYKAFKTGYKALMLSNLTAEALQNRTVSRDKVLEAGKKYYEAYRQWLAGPFAEYILLWTENLNLLTRGKIMGAAVGKPAPPVCVAKWFNTKPIPASAYQGKVVIVEIFRPKCPPCRSTAPHLASLYTVSSGKKSACWPAAVRKFCGVGWTVLIF